MSYAFVTIQNQLAGFAIGQQTTHRQCHIAASDGLFWIAGFVGRTDGDADSISVWYAVTAGSGWTKEDVDVIGTFGPLNDSTLDTFHLQEARNGDMVLIAFVQTAVYGSGNCIHIYRRTGTDTWVKQTSPDMAAANEGLWRRQNCGLFNHPDDPDKWCFVYADEDGVDASIYYQISSDNMATWAAAVKLADAGDNGMTEYQTDYPFGLSAMEGERRIIVAFEHSAGATNGLRLISLHDWDTSPTLTTDEVLFSGSGARYTHISVARCRSVHQSYVTWKTSVGVISGVQVRHNLPEWVFVSGSQRTLKTTLGTGAFMGQAYVEETGLVRFPYIDDGNTQIQNGGWGELAATLPIDELAADVGINHQGMSLAVHWMYSGLVQPGLMTGLSGLLNCDTGGRQQLRWLTESNESYGGARIFGFDGWKKIWTPTNTANWTSYTNSSKTHFFAERNGRLSIFTYDSDGSGNAARVIRIVSDDFGETWTEDVIEPDMVGVFGGYTANPQIGFDVNVYEAERGDLVLNFEISTSPGGDVRPLYRWIKDLDQWFRLPVEGQGPAAGNGISDARIVQHPDDWETWMELTPAFTALNYRVSKNNLATWGFSGSLGTGAGSSGIDHGAFVALEDPILGAAKMHYIWADTTNQDIRYRYLDGWVNGVPSFGSEIVLTSPNGNSFWIHATWIDDTTIEVLWTERNAESGDANTAAVSYVRVENAGDVTAAFAGSIPELYTTNTGWWEADQDMRAIFDPSRRVIWADNRRSTNPFSDRFHPELTGFPRTVPIGGTDYMSDMFARYEESDLNVEYTATMGLVNQHLEHYSPGYGLKHGTLLCYSRDTGGDTDAVKGFYLWGNAPVMYDSSLVPETTPVPSTFPPTTAPFDWRQTVVSSALSTVYPTSMLTRDANGRFHVIYKGPDGGVDHIFSRHSDDGGRSWSGEQLIHNYGTTPTNEPFFVRMGVDGVPYCFCYHADAEGDWTANHLVVYRSREIYGVPFWELMSDTDLADSANGYRAVAVQTSGGRWYYFILNGGSTGIFVSYIYSDDSCATWSAESAFIYTGGSTSPVIRDSEYNIRAICDQSDVIHLSICDMDASGDCGVQYLFGDASVGAPGSWTQEEVHTTGNAPNGSDANNLVREGDIAIDVLGDVYITWISNTGVLANAERHVWFNKRTSGGWGTAVRVSAGSLAASCRLPIIWVPEDALPRICVAATGYGAFPAGRNMVTFTAASTTGTVWDAGVEEPSADSNDNYDYVSLPQQFTSGLRHTRLLQGLAIAVLNETQNQVEFWVSGLDSVMSDPLWDDPPIPTGAPTTAPPSTLAPSTLPPTTAGPTAAPTTLAPTLGPTTPAPTLPPTTPCPTTLPALLPQIACTRTFRYATREAAARAWITDADGTIIRVALDHEACWMELFAEGTSLGRVVGSVDPAGIGYVSFRLPQVLPQPGHAYFVRIHLELPGCVSLGRRDFPMGTT